MFLGHGQAKLCVRRVGSIKHQVWMFADRLSEPVSHPVARREHVGQSEILAWPEFASTITLTDFRIDRRIVQPILPQPLLNELSRYERMRLFFVLIADGLDFIGQGSSHEACESIATLSLKNESPSVQEKYGRFLRN